MENRFSASERNEILRYVRGVIGHKLAGLPVEPPPEIDKLHARGGCFVTLNSASGELRGCIGTIDSPEPLGDNLRRNALNAAIHDPRFAPVAPDELPSLTIEVSILTSPTGIGSPEEFVVGRHGIILELGQFHAVFLPQVAPEQGWNRETTLRYLSRKAGLPADAWKHPQARFSVFEAEVFSEKK
ncbi:MAG: AmmeMemoRadiSam system protein A [Victivallaceae bacterium]|nr:AmmeMemoRadiSam system protein A [Victivallaceae bacterium]